MDRSKKMNTLFEFVKNGKFGSIELGTTKEIVESELGKPDDISLSKKPLILKYGSLQLAFYHSKDKHQYILNSIHFYFDDDFYLPVQILEDSNIPLEISEFIARADQHGIELVEDKRHTFPNLQKGYKSISNVVVIFNSEGIKDKLVSIHLSE